MEHICDLPRVIARAALLLRDGGVFSASIPSQGRLLWTLGYKLTTGLEFRMKYKLNYDTIMLYEHVNSQKEIIEICRFFFARVEKSLFGLCDSLSFYTHLSCREPNLAHARAFLASLEK